MHPPLERFCGDRGATKCLALRGEAVDPQYVVPAITIMAQIAELEGSPGGAASLLHRLRSTWIAERPPERPTELARAFVYPNSGSSPAPPGLPLQREVESAPGWWAEYGATAPARA